MNVNKILIRLHKAQRIFKTFYGKRKNKNKKNYLTYYCTHKCITCTNTASQMGWILFCLSLTINPEEKETEGEREVQRKTNSYMQCQKYLKLFQNILHVKFHNFVNVRIDKIH